MGNCTPKPRKSLAEISPADIVGDRPVVRLSGSLSSLTVCRIRIVLLYKAVSVRYVTENPVSRHDAAVLVLKCGSDTVSGTYEMVLQYIEARFPEPPLVSGLGEELGGGAVVVAVTLQHRSMRCQLDRMVRWVEDLATRGGSISVDMSVGSSRMEVRKFGRRYSQLLEVMLEHAQMEERIVFPVLESADRGLSKAANGEHARDLPIMNGIKEDIKSIVVLEAGSHDHQEALLNLSSRLKILQEHCKEHFEQEERELLPLLEAAELSKERQEGVLAQCLEMMESTHSHLFHFLLAGLLPHEAILYLDLVVRCSDHGRAVAMLRELTARMEGKTSTTSDPHKGSSD